MNSAGHELRILVERLPHHGDLPLPDYGSELAAGADLMAAIGEGEEIILAPGRQAMVPTGIGIALPQGFEAQVRPRSGLAARSGITVLNSPGTIDADYRGEVKVILINHGAEPFVILRGMRIAQIVVAPVTRAIWVEAESLPGSARGDGGFGSTGIQGGIQGKSKGAASD